MGHSRWTTTLDHYGLQSTRINRGQSHENGVAEQGHYRLKDAIDQALILRGSRDFDTTDDYADFVREMVAKRNRLVQGKLEQELPSLGPLPPAPMPEYANYRSKVRRWSTVQVAGLTYSVPSRLIGKEVRIRLYSDHLEVYYKDNLVERMARMHGEGEANVNYRHVIGSLVRKPGPSLAIASGSSCFPPCASASPMTHSGNGVGNGPTWSTCRSCTWRRPPWKPRWTASWTCCWKRESASTTPK